VDTLLATATPAGPIDLSWTNEGDAQDGFEILRSTSLGGLNPSTSVIASVGSGQTTYTDDTVQPNTTYYYEILAFDTTADSQNGQGYWVPNPGNSDGYSNIANATTAPIDTGYVLQETVQVPVITQSGVWSNTILQAGVTYEIIASGYMDLGGAGALYRADAEYGYLFPMFPNSIPPLTNARTTNVAYGIGIDSPADTSSRFPYWGPPSTTADHEYAIMYTPTVTGPIELNFHDDYYPDNLQLEYPMQVGIYRALPSAPGNLTATPDHGNEEIDLTWTNLDSAATSVVVERAQDGGTYSVIATLPAGSTSYSDGLVTYNQGYSYQVYAQNSFGQSGPSDTVYAVIVNLPPQIATIPPQTANIGSEFLYDVSATDPQDGQAGLAYSISGDVPTGMIIDPATGQISGWRPISDQLDYSLNPIITVTDGEGSSTSLAMNVTVAPPLNAIPTVTARASGTPSSTTIALSVTGTDSSGGSDIGYTWETVSQSSQGGAPIFSVNGTNAASQTVATVYGAGSYMFNVILSNGPDFYGVNWIGDSQTPAVTIEQTLGSVEITPVEIDAIAGSTSPVQFTAQALDQFGQPMYSQPAFTWSVLGGTGSAGGSINPSTGAYTPPRSVPSGTPSDIIQASATVGGVTQTANANVSVPSAALSPIVINSTSAVATNSCTLRLTASAHDPNYQNDSQLIYIWTVAGAWPTLSLSNGTTAGSTVYATWANPPGTFDCTFTLTVEDPLGLIQSASLPVNISAANLPPAPQNLAATPQGNGSINLTWSTNLTGGTQLYAIFRNTSATLPNTPLTTLAASQNSSRSVTDSSGLLSGVTYYYWVEAINSSGYSPASTMVSKQLSAGTPTLTVPSAMTVTGTTAGLSVTGSDPTGNNEPISYNWSIISAPQGANVQLNGAAPSATNTVTTITNLMNATFSQAGSYTFQVIAIDASGFSDPKDVSVTVQQVATSISVSADSSIVQNNQTATLAATGLDQFNNSMSLGTSGAWSVQTGGVGGAISGSDPTNGAYVAPATGTGQDVAKFSENGVSGAISLTIIVPLSVSAVDDSTVMATLNWTSMGSAAMYYDIFRDMTPGFTPTLDNMITEDWTDSTFVDDELSAATTYYYQVYGVSSNGDVTLVGTASVATPASDGPLCPIGGGTFSLAGAQTSAATSAANVPPSSISDESPNDALPLDSSPTAPISNVYAAGVNDRELLVSWKSNVANTAGYLVQIKVGNGDWLDVGEASAGESNYIIRGNGNTSGVTVLQQGVTYYVRVAAADNKSSEDSLLWSDGSASAQVVAPNVSVDLGRDFVIVVGGKNQPMERLLQGVTVSPQGTLQGTGYSVGAVWVWLVNHGYNAFLSADPADGGEYGDAKEPGTVYPSLNPDGTGRIFDELLADNGIGGARDIGLIGYSHGGGMIYNISQELWDDRSIFNPNPLRVVFAATIDAIDYGTCTSGDIGYNEWASLKKSPATIWNAVGVNYYESQGYEGAMASWWKRAFGAWAWTVYGVEIPGVVNHNMDGLDHSTIGTDPWVLGDVETQTIKAFSQIGY